MERHALTSQAKLGIEAMVSLASSDPTAAISASALDRHKGVLNLQNGTLDLCTINTATGGSCPRGEFLQRIAAYGLTGSAEKDVMFFLYGLVRWGEGVPTHPHHYSPHPFTAAPARIT